MSKRLSNINVAILEHRFTKEFATLFERQGATVFACPMLEERPAENRQELQDFVRRTVSGQFDMIIFLTGVGAKFLISEAEASGLKDDFLRALEGLTIVVRGPKPVAALRQVGVHADIVPANPTTEGVIESLDSSDLRGRRVGVQLYGTPNPQLAAMLEAKGAKVTTVQVYAYGTASDSAAVETFIGRIINGEIRVIAFTSSPQVRMLFDFASQFGNSEALQQSLREKVVIASIGEVTTRALGEKHLTPKIVPAQSKMAALAQAVADFF